MATIVPSDDNDTEDPNLSPVSPLKIPICIHPVVPVPPVNPS